MKSDANRCTKIIVPPSKLLIFIDYGNNEVYKPSNITFDRIIDITKFVNFDYGTTIKYQINWLQRMIMTAKQ